MTTPAPSPAGLGRMMVGAQPVAPVAPGVKPARQRRKDDYYPTHHAVTRALAFAEAPAMRAALARHGQSLVWEPCGRGGAIARVLAEFGLPMVATDLVPDPGNHVAQLDLLQSTRALSPVVCTNPPFGNMPIRIMQHLLFTLNVDYLALLLKANWFHQGRACSIWRTRRPCRRWDMTWKPDFTGEGEPVMNFSWFVWDRAAANDGISCTANLLTRDGPADA